jgi:hypothetical protein
MRRISTIIIVVVATTLAALTALVLTPISFGLDPGPGHGLRYCERPGGPGNYLAASPSVGCATARKVRNKTMSPVCVYQNRCYAYGFTCLAYWDGRYDRPFDYTHHGICRSGRRRIDFDTG